MYCAHCEKNTPGDEEGKCMLCGRPLTPAPVKKEVSVNVNPKNGIPVEDLPQEALEKLGEPPPARPDLTDKSSAERMRILGKYYDDNAPSIRQDIETLGEEATRKKWGISPNGWIKRRARIMQEKSTKPRAYRRGKTKDTVSGSGPTGEPANKEKTPGIFESIEELRGQPVAIQLAYFQGWHDASLVFLGSTRRP